MLWQLHKHTMNKHEQGTSCRWSFITSSKLGGAVTLFDSVHVHWGSNQLTIPSHSACVCSSFITLIPKQAPQILRGYTITGALPWGAQYCIAAVKTIRDAALWEKRCFLTSLCSSHYIYFLIILFRPRSLQAQGSWYNIMFVSVLFKVSFKVLQSNRSPFLSHMDEWSFFMLRQLRDRRSWLSCLSLTFNNKIPSDSKNILTTLCGKIKANHF